MDFVMKAEEGPEPIYRKDRPQDRAVLASNGDTVLVVDWIGPDLDWWHSCTGWEGDFEGTPTGLWIWEGRLSTNDAEPDDNHLEGGLRALTNEELRAYVEGDDLWEDGAWIKGWKNGEPENPLTRSSPATLLPQPIGFYEGHDLHKADMPVVWSVGATPRDAVEALCAARWEGHIEGELTPIPGGANAYEWGFRFTSDNGTGFKAAGIYVPGGAITTWWK